MTENIVHFLNGALAQLARASALHAEGHGFDSHTLHIKEKLVAPQRNVASH